jgi:hypothetical protein
MKKKFKIEVDIKWPKLLAAISEALSADGNTTSIGQRPFGDFVCLRFDKADVGPVENKLTADELSALLETEIVHTDLQTRTKNALVNAEMQYVWQVITKSRRGLLRTKKFADSGLRDVYDFFHRNGLPGGEKLSERADILAAVEKLRNKAGL